MTTARQIVQPRPRGMAPDGALQDLLADLQREWPALNMVERGDRLKKLVDLRMSRRKLAKELSIDEKTVRRHLRIAARPEWERQIMMARSRRLSPLIRACRSSRLLLAAGLVSFTKGFRYNRRPVGETHAQSGWRGGCSRCIPIGPLVRRLFRKRACAWRDRRAFIGTQRTASAPSGTTQIA